VRGREVTIADLQVDAYLELHEGVSLRPPDGGSILLGNEVEIKFVASTVEGLPQLDIGVTGVEIVPKVVRVVVEEEGAGDVRMLVIRGRPFDKCEEWKEAIEGLPRGVEGECCSVAGARILASGERGIYLVRKEDGGGVPIVIIAGVVGVVAVMAILVVGYLVHKNGKETKTYSRSFSQDYSPSI
jgi:hypothetical protein